MLGAGSRAPLECQPPSDRTAGATFAEAWPDESIVQGVLAQSPWYHQLALLDKLKNARSSLKLAIEDTLDRLPEAYDRPLYARMCSALFEHVYESYPERDAGVA